MSEAPKIPTGRTEIAAPGDTTIVLTRTFDAPRELVWRLWNDPELIPEFWGPRDTTTRVETYDLRVGGAWRLVNVEADGTEHGFRGEFREVTPYDLLVYTFEYEPMAGNVSVESMRFEEHDGRTTITTTTEFDTKEQRDAMFGSGMESGANELYDRLDELIERQRPRR